MGWSSGTALEKMGLLNKETPDLRDLYGTEEREIVVGYCSGACARGTFKAKGIPRVIGQNKSHCPICGTEITFYQSMPPKAAEQLKTIIMN
jgi:hypothetical protein